MRVVCPEMPETWLFDVVEQGSLIDPVFISVIEEHTLCAIGAGVWVEGTTAKSSDPHAKILIGGIRKGFSGRRFVPQTQEQMDRSVRFWSEQSA